MQSDLLSGGLEPHLFCLLEKESLKRMLQAAKESQNQELEDLIIKSLDAKSKDLESEVYKEEEKLLLSCFSEEVDANFALLERGLLLHMRSKPALSYGRIGGENGRKLTRVAFAAYIKLSGLYADLDAVLNELEYATISFAEDNDDAKQDKEILDVLKADPRFDSIFNCWAIASKMRIWLNGKRQSLHSRYVREDQPEEEQAKGEKTVQEEVDKIVEKITSKGRLLISLAQPTSFA